MEVMETKRKKMKRTMGLRKTFQMITRLIISDYNSSTIVQSVN